MVAVLLEADQVVVMVYNIQMVRVLMAGLAVSMVVVAQAPILSMAAAVALVGKIILKLCQVKVILW
jgi:hypothetical protein